MTDERHAFIEDVTERSRNAKGYYNSNGKQRPMAIDQSKLPEAVTNERDGECTSVQLDRPMTKDEFLKLSDDLKVEYLNHLIDKYGVGRPTIGKMLGVSKTWLDWYIKAKMSTLAIHKGSYCPTNDQKKAWAEFCEKSDSKPEPVSITRPSGYELVTDALIRTANGVPTEVLARSYDMTLRQFRMTFQFEYTKIIREPGTELYKKLKALMAKMTNPIRVLYQLYGLNYNRNDIPMPKYDSDAMPEEEVGEIMKKIEEPVSSKKEARPPRDESSVAPSSMQLQFASVDNWESLFETLRGIPLPKNAIQVRESVTGEV